MTKKKRKCKPQNYNCGKICIKGTYVCKVGGLTGQSVSIANLLVEIVKQTKPVPSFQTTLDKGKNFVISIISENRLNQIVNEYEKGENDFYRQNKDRNLRLNNLESRMDSLSDEEFMEFVALNQSSPEPPDLTEYKIPFTQVLNSLKEGSITDTNVEISGRKFLDSEKALANVQEAAGILGLNQSIGLILNNQRASTSARHYHDFDLRKRIDQLSNEGNFKEAIRLSKKAYNETGGYINAGLDIGTEASKLTHYHETAHQLEFANPELIKKNKEFVESRRTGPNGSLNDKNSAYGKNETYAPDEFISDYVGRIYSDKYGVNDISAGTEVFSMGFEKFSRESLMLDFYSKDPEHFYLTVGTILEAQNR